MPTDNQDTTPTDRMRPTGIVELGEESLQAVAGGLNPQPLPPRSEPRLD